MNPIRSSPITRRAALAGGAAVLASVAGTSAYAADAATRVLIVVGPSKHPPGTHEVEAGGRVLKHCLEATEKLKAEIVTEWPAEGEKADVLLSQAITHAHRELAASDARLKVVSLPLRDGDKVVGAVTIESTAEGPADIASVELVQAALDLVTPVLVVRRSDDRVGA